MAYLMEVMSWKLKDFSNGEFEVHEYHARLEKKVSVFAYKHNHGYQKVISCNGYILDNL